MGSKDNFLKNPDDLPRIVDAVRERMVCARHIDLDEVAAGVEEAVGEARITDDLPRVVDAGGDRIDFARHIDLGQIEIGSICGRASSPRSEEEKGNYGKHSPIGI